MLVSQLLPFIKSLCSRKWTDEDIVEDVQFLRDELNANFESLTFVPYPLHCCNLSLRLTFPCSVQDMGGIYRRTRLWPPRMVASTRVGPVLAGKCYETLRAGLRTTQVRHTLRLTPFCYS